MNGALALTDLLTHIPVQFPLHILGAGTVAAAPADGAVSQAAGGAPWWIALIPLLPLLNTALMGVCAAAGVRSKLPAWLTVATLAVSFALTLVFFLGWNAGDHGPASMTAFEWIAISWGDGAGQSFVGNFAFVFDGLSLTWMLFVTGLSALIALYASEYMEHDAGPGYSRFFAAFSLFVFSMACLVMGDNLLMLFLGWEGVGLCSYLLIGHYYKRPAAVDAARKAFVVNRIGDLGLLVGLFLTFVTFGTLEYFANDGRPGLFGPDGLVTLNRTAGGAVLSETWQVWAIPLLLTMGAFGKSAQLFFYVWLPDAMEGPTPVSALIHAATMVTAGVYLVARFSPLFLQDPDLIALTVVTWSGTITALWAATIAMAQFDIKRIMGYSTVSQLGYMFAGIGMLSATGGVFHVVTHAFFKATLFLACGAVMHGFAGQLDMRKLSGLWRVPGFKLVTVAMLIGCLNLSGVPFTAGYFSKDMILAEAFVTPDAAIAGSSIAGWVLLLTAGLTAYYTFRVFFRVFVGPVIYEPGDDLHGEDPAHFHPHGPKWAVNGVLGALAILTIGATLLYPIGKHGWVGEMLHASPTHYELPWAHEGDSDSADDHADHDAGNSAADPALRTVALQEQPEPEPEPETETNADGDGSAGYAGLDAGADLEPGGILGGLDPHKVMYYVSAVFGVVGIAAAFFFHAPGIGRTNAHQTRLDPIARAIRPISTWAERKWLVDEFYHFIIVRPLRLISVIFASIDKLLIDGLVEGFGKLPRVLASAIRPSQSGVLHAYALRMAGGVAIVLFLVVVLTR